MSRKRAILRGSILAAIALLAVASISSAFAQTTSLHIVKYAQDGTTVVSETTVDYPWLEANLPVLGDGSTHYYHQGPTFDPDNLWDPDETVNLKDKGAVKGTDVADLCDLVGGMSIYDEVAIKADDGFTKRFPYGAVYAPQPRQGPLALCWWRDGQYVPNFWEGMQVIFMAETTNGAGRYVFGNTDMRECLSERYRHFYYSGGTMYPSTNGLSVKYVNEIQVFTCPDWDVNGDHQASIGDIVAIGLQWGLTGPPGWIREDVNNDGQVTIGDVVFVGLYWGLNW